MPENIAKLYESLDVDLKDEADNFIYYLVYKSQSRPKKKLSLAEIESFSGNGYSCPPDTDAQDYVNLMRQDREF